MACNDRTCMLSATVPFRAELTVDPEAPTAGASGPVATRATPPAPTQSKGLLALALWCLGGAVVSWVMPCVYPMIPITISFFGKMAEQKHSGRVGIAVSYGLGIAGTFIVSGLAVGLLALGVSDASERSGLASLTNDIATNPWVNLTIGLVFVAFALSMFGLFEFRVPNWLINKADSAGRTSKSTHVGSILLGITFALASFTCTVPVVGFLLGNAASGTGEGLFRSVYGMTVYGAAFAAPFVALSLFPGALASLPKAGGWMETVKVGFGFLELAAALKFVWVPDLEWSWGVLTRPVVLGLLLVVGLAACAFFLGLLPLGHGIKVSPFRVGSGRWVSVLATLVLLVPVTAYLASPPRYQAASLPLPDTMANLMESLLPPAPTDDDLARGEGWYVDDYAGALEEARREDRPLFIDFTGVYCINCRAMERNVFPRPEIQELLEQTVRTRLYVDRKEEKHHGFAKMQVERYGLSSQPYYVILDPRDETTLAEAGGYIPGEFQELLEQGLAKFQTRRGKDVARAGQ